MNERIKQVLIAGGIPTTIGTSVSFTSLDPLEHLVESVVKECLVSLWSEECMQSDLALEEFNRNVKKIKEHFGVE